MLAMMLQDLQCLGKLVVPVAVVAPVEMRIVWVARVQTVREELPVVVEEGGWESRDDDDENHINHLRALITEAVV